MNIIQVNLSDKKSVNEFLDFPAKLYSNCRQWVPPLSIEARQALDPEKNPFFKHSEAAFFLCFDEGVIQGRLAVINNHRYNKYNQSRTAFFHLFECQNKPEAANLLFSEGSKWAKARDLNEITGPKGFSLLDGMGLLIKGFEYRPAFGIPYNLPYYPELVETCGFLKTSDVYSGFLDPARDIPARMYKLSDAIQKRRGLKIARFSNRSELQRIIPYLKELYNGALEGTQGTYPLEDDEIKVMQDQLIHFADPSLIKIVMKTSTFPGQNEKPVGFLLAYPDISSSVQKSKGRLFPFGWLRMLLDSKQTEWIDINGAGMVNEYRGLGGTAILFSEMYKTIRSKKQFKHAEFVQIGADNEKMLRELKDLGCEITKIHRLYKKIL
ncbi:MAG: hypothetical protein WCP19_03050 [Chloroflexota bacterium]